jgi:N-acetylmuramoyl-L-alanine amidase
VIADQVSALVVSCAFAIAGAASHPVASPSKSPLRPLAGKVVTIDPGHNGGNFNDPAAINRLVNDGNGLKACDTTGTAAPDGYRETDFNWYVALDLRLGLIHEGATVVLTRHSNSGVGPCITQRAAIGNRAHSDVALSIHADGGPPSGSGFAILTPAPIPGGLDRRIIGPSSRFAIGLRSALERIGHLNPSNYDGVNGIAPRTDLGGLNLSAVPKVFVEVGNMQNPADEAPMETSRYRRRVAAALAAAITQFLAG